MSAVAAAGWLIGAGYFLVSRVVRDLFPFTVLPMYAGATASTSTHILAVDARGDAHYVDEFVAWKCDPPLQAQIPQCPQYPNPYSIPYVERDDARYVRDHTGTSNDPGGEQLAIVRRVWFLDAKPGPPKWQQCEITNCTAVRR